MTNKEINNTVYTSRDVIAVLLSIFPLCNYLTIKNENRVNIVRLFLHSFLQMYLTNHVKIITLHLTIQSTVLCSTILKPLLFNNNADCYELHDNILTLHCGLKKLTDHMKICKTLIR